VNTFLGHALVGWISNGGATTSKEIMAAFGAAKVRGVSDWGSDTEVFENAFHGAGGNGGVFQLKSAETVADIVAYFELQRVIKGAVVPQLLTLSQSRGAEKHSVGGTLNETVARFREVDVVFLKQAVPYWVSMRVRDFYRAFWGECHSDGVGHPVRCDKPLQQVWGRNVNDPYVHNAHSDRVGFFINQYLRPLAEAVAGRSLTPSYSYYVRYLDKPDGLQPHTDQVDNEYTMSVQLDYTPEERGPCELWVWSKRLPFQEEARNLEPMCPGAHDDQPHCESSGDAVGGRMNIGDAVLFRGRQHIHWRPRWQKGRTCAAVLQHFISRDNKHRRGDHNRFVCCSWPPLPEFNNELCDCPDGRLRAIQAKLKLILPR